MFIIPINSSINPIGVNSLNSNSMKNVNEVDENNSLGFKDMFQDLMTNVEKTEAATREDAYKLSIGEMDDVHNMMINAAKADMALQTMVQLRNKFLEAYSEVMRTNL